MAPCTATAALLLACVASMQDAPTDAKPPLRPQSLRDPAIAPRPQPPAQAAPRTPAGRTQRAERDALTRDGGGVRATRLYSPPGGPVEVLVRSGDPEAHHTLFLLDSAGEVLAMAKDIPPGRVDLLKVLPGVEGMQHAAWLQLARNEEAIGTPLVIQPLREPPPVRTMRSTRPDGVTQYTRIVGWGSEPLDPDDTTIDEVRRTWIDGDPPVLSGYRIYADMDVLMRTDHGEILLVLAPHEAPATVWNFRTLVRDGFYDGGGFHRVVPADREGRPFVIQGGDPTLSGNGGPGHALALEPSRLAHDYGVLSMARADEPHSAGSQFFIALGREATARLDGQYCAFGYAVSGARAIDSIASTPIADPATGRPAELPQIRSMRLVPAPARMPGIDRASDRVKPSAPAGDAPPTAR